MRMEKSSVHCSNRGPPLKPSISNLPRTRRDSPRPKNASNKLAFPIAAEERLQDGGSGGYRCLALVVNIARCILACGFFS